MNNFNIKDILKLPHSTTMNINPSSDLTIQNISTDSRTLQPGDVYLALVGENYDGHNFVDQAIAKKAMLCIVDKTWYETSAAAISGFPTVVVDNTRIFYGAIANAYRNNYDIPIIAITGSNGKTTTKDLVSAVLETRYIVHKNPGNYNNQIGLPSTLLDLRPDHEIAVIEMGTNQPGDIAELCTIAEPTVGIVTNIGSAHLEKLLSKENVAKEKMTLLNNVRKPGTVLVNADDEYLSSFKSTTSKIVSFGYSEAATVRLRECTLNDLGHPSLRLSSHQIENDIQIQMQTVGIHSAYAAAIAFAVGLEFNCSIPSILKSIEGFRSPARRLQLQRCCGVSILDDSYNANPDSLMSAIDTLVAMETSGRKIVVVGDMLELGEHAVSEHLSIGEYLKSKNISYVFSYGPLSENIHSIVKDSSHYAQHFTDKQDIATALCELATENDVILVKGSNGMGMNAIIDLYITQCNAKEVS